MSHKITLAEHSPEIAAEWHPSKNGDLKPTEVTAGSNKKVWWQCANGHEWFAKIANRSNGTGCPECARRKRVMDAVKCKGSLVDRFPELAAEWHPTKNGALAPENVTYGSCKKVWWKCSACGHEYQTAVIHRTRSGTGCPICRREKYKEKRHAHELYVKGSLKDNNSTLSAEWHPTKNGTLTPEQVTIGSNKKVWWQCARGHEFFVSPNSRTQKYSICPYCANKKILPGYNDLATKNPKLAQEWHPTKNGELTPEYVLYGSGKKVWWLGPCGHEWSATVSNRNAGKGCPICSGKQVLVGFNDLLTTNPTLCEEWHPTKNGDLTPSHVSCGSNKKVWWKCTKGHEWEAIIENRAGGAGCPYCNNHYTCMNGGYMGLAQHKIIQYPAKTARYPL